MSLESHPGRRVVSDPLALRALAHPLRMKLHGLVGREGGITAAEAARQLGVSQALASHHLRQLAKYGFVEPGPAGDNRERPWRIKSVSHEFRDDSTAESREAVDVIERLIAENALAQLAEWQERSADEDPRWTGLAGAGQSLLYLTIDETAELSRQIDALFSRWVRERPIGEPDKLPPDAVPVNFSLVITPLRPTVSGG